MGGPRSRAELVPPRRAPTTDTATSSRTNATRKTVRLAAADTAPVSSAPTCRDLDPRMGETPRLARSSTRPHAGVHAVCEGPHAMGGDRPDERLDLGHDELRSNNGSRGARARNDRPDVPAVLARSQGASSPHSFQWAGTVSSGPVVFAENASTEPLKNSTWYAEAPGAGAHAKRRALGFAVSPTLPFWTRLLGTDGTGARLERRGCCRRSLRCLRRCWRPADLHPHIEEQ